ncbi:hypothetical protein BDV98DRAFT_121869 [Pterulicium gracile]|uniref:Uncharacterized protein n=1 Tax=Pterulicium gracile TaxID=1884261 RepID=A0A5C3QPA1_9AGAR|nr:hypothetical protein BDV98DRAFT_121869 [Pterula gracilis]
MSSSVQIIVDDFDPRITYTPSDKWTTGGVELEHNSTTHGFNDGAGSFAFNFNGTGISIYTTVPPFERETPPGVVCKIDGTEIERFTPTGAAYNFLACRSPTLDADKDHLLEVEVTRMAAWPTFHLDYMIYESVVGDNTKGAEGSRLVGPEGESVRIMVDEADGRVVYGGPEGAWRDGGVDAEHNGTTHVTDTGGATATYTFFGTGIQVYGTLVEETSSKSPFIATFQIDDSPPVIYTSPSIKGLQYRRRFFRSPVLEENVEHKLVIMDTTEGAGRFIL